MAELDYSEGALPLYTQVAYRLCRRIQNGEFTTGSFLPSQSELSSYYGVSRITIINAIRFLTERGILRSQQGKGSLVLKSTIGMDSYVEEGFSMQFRKHGFSTTTSVLSSSIVKANYIVSENLSVREGDDVVELRRLRYIEGVPACYEQGYYRIIPGIADVALKLKDNESLYSSIRKNGIELDRAEERMEASEACENVAENLNIPQNSPILLVHRRTFSRFGQGPLEYCMNSYNTAVYGSYGIVTINLRPERMAD